jgi:hypothetical protein
MSATSPSSCCPLAAQHLLTPLRGDSRLRPWVGQKRLVLRSAGQRQARRDECGGHRLAYVGGRGKESRIGLCELMEAPRESPAEAGLRL